MNKKVLLFAALLGISAGGFAQKKGFSYKFYGQVPMYFIIRVPTLKL